MKKVLLSVFIFICMFSFSFSAEYAGDDNYKDPSFYEDTEAEDIDWSLADVGKVPPKVMEKVPAEKAADDFDVLSDEQKKEMTPDQIVESLDKISDLSSEVDSNRASQAIEDKYGTKVGIEGSVSVDEEGNLGTPAGDSVNLNEDIYGMGVVTVDEEGKINLAIDEDNMEFNPDNVITKSIMSGMMSSEDVEIFLNQTSDPIEIPEGDSFNLELPPNRISTINLGGKDLTLSGNFRISDEGYLEIDLSSEDSCNFLGKICYVNDVAISSLYGEDNLKISFDDSFKGKPGFLTIQDSEISYNKGGDSTYFELGFKAQNDNFFNFEKFFGGPTFDISPAVEDLSIISRNSEGLIPLVKVKLDEHNLEDSTFRVFNGPITLDFANEAIISEYIYSKNSNSYEKETLLGKDTISYIKRSGIDDSSLSFPMRIEISGENIGSSGTYLTSGFNEIFVLGDKGGLAIDDGTQALNGYQSSYSETLSFNADFTAEMIEQRYNVEVPQEYFYNHLTRDYKFYDVPSLQSKVALKRLYDVLGNIPSKVLGAVNVVNLLPSVYYEELVEGKNDQLDEPNMATDGVAYFDNNQIFIKDYSDQGSLFRDSVVYHEVAHIFESKVNLDYFDKTTYGTEGYEPPEIKYDLGLQWRIIHDENYGIYSEGAIWDEGYSSEFENNIFGPGYGCFRAYGCKNNPEDVATTVENVFECPSCYDQLINPSVEDRRYIKKLALANEFGFFPETWLETRLQAVGYDRACIDDVTNGNGYESECIQ